MVTLSHLVLSSGLDRSEVIAAILTVLSLDIQPDSDPTINSHLYPATIENSSLPTLELP